MIEMLLATGTPPSGEAVFTAASLSRQWTVPEGVRRISVVMIGGGAGGYCGPYLKGGGGGGLLWHNDLPVTPGEVLTINVGRGGPTDYGTSATYNATRSAGGETSLRQNGQRILYATGGYGTSGGTNGATAGVAGASGGGSGGSASSGGGGAGGYSGNGGDGGSSGTQSRPGTGTAGSGGGGGGGGGHYGSVYSAGGGGVGLYGEGASGIGGSDTAAPGGGGSGGEKGGAGSSRGGAGGRFGGGGGCSTSSSDTFAKGAQGALRIVWGQGRAFPSTKVDEASSQTVEIY
ncbi:glycine-rich domain-containing protein [uncultured Croceicoccus sp.]|uniref:glycine-rich domain-containing protein n=1 Tax=uncultured Croceicoccus sp. TaxID=1295329 RepID=UPI0026036E7D|nr:hypothetical protein [uncultured Croceicoccus sp.]